ncbi:MAG: hypothetical protein OQJ77_04205 [Thiovulaceae bacterium]|nr:hypothetical protein [Sulfurimonadaceae bacterium]
MKVKNIKFISSLIFYALISTSCYAGDNENTNNVTNCVDKNSEETNDIVNEFILDVFKPSLHRFRLKRSDLVKRFGKYKVTSSEITSPNYHEPGEKIFKIKKEVWGFTGVILHVESAISNKTGDKISYSINKILITKNKHQLRLPINIGSTKDEIICQLGDAPITDVKDESGQRQKMSYATWGASDNGEMKIYLDPNSLAEKIVLEFFVD